MKKKTLLFVLVASSFVAGILTTTTSCKGKKSISSYDNSGSTYSDRWEKYTRISYVTNCEDITIEYSIGIVGSPYTLPQPTREGYDFLGWYKDDKFNKVFVDTTYPETDTILYAKWKAKEYTLSFDIYGNGNKTVSTVSYGDPIIYPEAKVNGYELDGWNFNGESFELETMPNYDVSLVGVWSVVNYSYVYYLDGGVNAEENLSTYNVELDDDTLHSPTKTGYRFLGWYTDDNFTNRVYAYPLENSNLYAYWQINGYGIDFESEYGELENTHVDYLFGDEVTLPTLYQAGADFIGWKNGDVLCAQSFTMPDSNLSLVAEWQLISYTIYYDLDGGSFKETAPTSYDIEYKTTLIKPTKEGYDFVGWYVDSDLKVKFSNFTTGNITLYAKYSVNSYDIKFNTNCELTQETLSFEFGEQVTLPPIGRSGYKFLGWYNGDVKYESGFSMPASNLSLEAKWELEEYDLILEDGDSKSSTKVKYTSSVKLDSPEKPGYNFIGWYSGSKKYESGFSMPASSLTLVAKYEEVTYTATYISSVECTNNNLQSFKVSNDLVLLSPVAKGYDFAGWYETDEEGNEVLVKELPLRNVTLTAKWNIAHYTITYNCSNLGVQGEMVSSYTIFDEVTLPTINYDYCDFGGWYLEGHESNVFYKIEKGSTGDMEIFAVENRYLEVEYGSLKGLTAYGIEKYKNSTLTISNKIYGEDITNIGLIEEENTINKVIINNGITTIEAGAFSNFTSLSAIEIPYTVNSIGNKAFENTKITSLDLSEISNLSVTPLTFRGMSSLKTISFGSNFSSFSTNMFSQSTPLEVIKYDNNKFDFENNISSLNLESYSFGPSSSYYIEFVDYTKVYKDKTTECIYYFSTNDNEISYSTTITFEKGEGKIVTFPVCTERGYYYTWNINYKTNTAQNVYSVTDEYYFQPYYALVSGSKTEGYLDYTITLMNVEGSDYKAHFTSTSFTVNNESPTMHLPTLYKPGYVGEKWYTSPTFSDDTEKQYILATTKSSLRLYVKWECIYTVSNNEIKGITEAYETYSSKYTSFGTDLTFVPIEYNGKTITVIGEINTELCLPYSSVVIGEGITKIEDYAFSYLNYFYSISIPSSVTYIGFDAFSSNITSINSDSVSVTYGGTTGQFNNINICIGGIGYYDIVVTCSDGTVKYSSK